jgi:hypothetical protein
MADKGLVRGKLQSRIIDTVDSKEKYAALKFGDVVYFESSSAPKGFLQGDGLVSKEVGLQTTGPSKPNAPANFVSCLFRVVPKLKYAAADQLRQRSVRSKSSPHIDYFHEYAALEARKNNQLLEEAKVHENLQYAEICQLQHVQSGLFLTSERDSAANQKGCFRLLLSGGNSMSYFFMMPRFNYRSEGGLIYCNDILCINSKKVAEHSIHPTTVKVSPVDLPASVRTSSITEVNLSSETSGWKICLHHRPFSNKLLHANQPIRFYHPEGSDMYTLLEYKTTKLLDKLVCFYNPR